MKLPFFVEKQLNRLLKPQLNTILKIYVDGKLKRKLFGKSLNANFMQYLYGFLSSGSNGYVVEFPQSQAPYTQPNSFMGISPSPITRVELSISSGSVAICNVNGTLNDDTIGIVIGDGNTAVQADDWKLDNQIFNGSGIGQLLYGNVTSPISPHIVGNTSSFVLRRTFNNSFGATVTIKEIGLYAARGTGNSVCFYRDVITPLNVLDTQTLEVELTWSITA